MARRMSSHAQLDLFAAPASAAPSSAVGAAARAPDLEALAARLPAHLYLGTSSWAFPGWQELVYDRAVAPSVLVPHGLAAYMQHPLRRTVGLDRTFYAPLPVADLAAYAAAVSDDFRFLVKAHAWCTRPVLRGARHVGPRRRTPNAHFLDPNYANEQVVQLCLAGLRDKTGPLLLHCAPLDVRAVGGPQRFAACLHAFLAALLRGPQYAVELRTASLLTPAYREALLDLGVCHCCTVHPSMPALQEQMRVVSVEAMPALIIRWTLPPAQRYAEAAARYQPCDCIVDDDPVNRQHIAAACRAALAAGHPTFVIAHDKAEGSAPCTIARLAACLAQATRCWHRSSVTGAYHATPRRKSVPVHA